MKLLFVFLVCLIASTVGGACGIGGGVLIKPLLDATGVLSISAASFLSGLTVLAMALISLWRNRKTRELDGARSLPLGVGAALGGIAGKKVFSALQARYGAGGLVGILQSLLLALLVLGTLLYVLNKKRIVTKNVQSPAVGGIIGLLLGFCSSFLGIGGGPMNLAVLYYFFSMDTKKAAVNSILIILISQLASLTMTLVSGTVPAFEPVMLAVMVAAGALGGLVSAKLHQQLTARQIDRMFLGLLVVILLICGYNMVKLAG